MCDIKKILFFNIILFDFKDFLNEILRKINKFLKNIFMSHNKQSDDFVNIT